MYVYMQMENAGVFYKSKYHRYCKNLNYFWTSETGIVSSGRNTGMLPS